MSVFRCKMCGGSLEIRENQTTAVCEYCGTTQTLPRLEDERRANLYDRANHFRRNNEFDKAMGIYEKILNEDSTDAEAYWSLVLCRYGIEYVEDPATHKRVPTVNRAQFTSIFDDEDYKSALQYADNSQKAIYQAEAEAINEIQKGILAISQKEEPFDVFICYKETDAQGRRTPDSVLANDLYHQLTQEGFKVFFSRITLEDKLGTAYEPYIFAALNSAKVMVVIGTKPEYFNAVWVKNEWSRYLALIKSGAKKVLIPAYRDMDPYDLPEEFSHLQAQDMSKLGFMQDLIRGIKKLADEKPQTTAAKEKATSGNSVNTAALLRRAFMYLEDGEWESADEYCEKVLDMEPENPQAYLGKLMADMEVTSREQLRDVSQSFENSPDYRKILRFGDSALQNELKEYAAHIRDRIEQERQQKIYLRAKNIMNRSMGITESTEAKKRYWEAQSLFASIEKYEDAKQMAEKCKQLADEVDFEDIYVEACKAQKTDFEIYLVRAMNLFQSIPQWKDAAKRAKDCELRIEYQRKEAEKRRIEDERKRKRSNAIILIVCAVLAIVVAGTMLYNSFVEPMLRYNQGVRFIEEGEYEKAISIFTELGEYKDSADQILEARYVQAEDFLKSGQYEEATIAFALLGDYKDSANRGAEIAYNQAEDYFQRGDLAQAAINFGKAGTYLDAQERAEKLWAQIVQPEVIATGANHNIGLKADGTVLAAGNNAYGQCEVSGWSTVVAISVGRSYTVGLKSDGTVIAVGDNEYGQCNVSDWSGIVSVSAGGDHTVGLKSDGTVIAVGDNEYGQCAVSSWNDIIAVSAGYLCTVGLKADGTVVAVGNNEYGVCDVSDWSNIVAIAAGAYHTVGLKSDGTVVTTGQNIDDQDYISQWRDIIAVAAGLHHTVGLKSDGTVLSIGDPYGFHGPYGQAWIEEWTDVVAISAGEAHTVGLKSDGTVVAVGYNEYGECDISDWRDLYVPKKNMGE